MNPDWKDTLASLLGNTPEADDKNTLAAAPDRSDGHDPSTPILHIVYEKKGRKGKPATIIYGFDPSNDDLLQQTASRMKRQMGVGGSARGGEILLQGDCRKKAADLLKEYGFKVR